MEAVWANPSLSTAEQLRIILAKRFPGERFDHMERAQLWKMYEEFAIPKEQRQTQRPVPANVCIGLPKDGQSRKRTYDMMKTPTFKEPQQPLIRRVDSNGGANGGHGAMNGTCVSPLKRPRDKETIDVSQVLSPSKRQKITWP